MILVVDDDKSIRLSLKLVLERNGYEVALADNPKAAMQVIWDVPAVELVLMDMNYSNSTDGEEGLTLLKQIKVFRPDVPCILMTAWGTIDLAVQGMRAGAFDFITKPWDNGVLLDRIETATQIKNSKFKIQNSPHSLEEGLGVRLPSLSDIYSTVTRVAPTNAPVLITGESGTGKELIAEAIHRQSHRANGPFVKVNLGGISTSLFESEMFGHKKGSFTDATSDRVGRFELAKGGTIFLDEIGELSPSSQVKLLRVLQDQTYEVLGDSHTRRTDARVVCATNADLRKMVEEHTFREDLFFRINLINLHLPPLRERREDIPLLVDHFLQLACAANKLPRVKVSADAIAYLQTLPFTGNIRELKNLVERALLMKASLSPNPSPVREGNQRGECLLTSNDFQSNYSPTSSINTPLSPGRGVGGEAWSWEGGSLDSMERSAVAACIARNNGNLSLVAKELGISRGALYRKIEKYGL
ncbi:MAG: sigma-54-dependent Fis family transcriptional regulator [Bacteroidaceae bacterium]|nr:sigma-54-dependent Fis family transcriptional regulator [Bacteroidaceae bacterium]